MLAPLLAGAVMAAVPAPEATAALPPCTVGVSVGFAREDGSIDSLPQSGVLLVLRNVVSLACAMPGLPKLRFEDEAGRALAVLRESPPGMHPEPVVTPLVLAPGAEASAALQWVSADVNGDHHCTTPYEIVIGEGPDAPTVPWRFGALCGEPAKPVWFRQPVLRAGPIPPR